jgi:hypothetical protein
MTRVLCTEKYGNMDIQQVGCGGMDWIELAQDREFD